MPKKHPKLVGKLKAWLVYYLDSDNPDTFFNATGAARAAGYRCKTVSSFRAIGSQNYAKLNFYIAKWLDNNGLSDARLKQKLNYLLDAKETKFFQHEGKVIESCDVEALGIQAKALDMAIKIKGLYAPEEHKHTGEIKHTHELSDDLKSVLDMAYDGTGDQETSA
jgi:hypothetical protein